MRILKRSQFSDSQWRVMEKLFAETVKGCPFAKEWMNFVLAAYRTGHPEFTEFIDWDFLHRQFPETPK